MRKIPDFLESGKLVEQEIFGKVDYEYFKAVENSYLSYKQAIEAVKKMQPGDPSDPDAIFASDMHATVADLLGLDDYKKLEFYTAVPGTHLDVHHGVDAFFELETDKGILRVTLDVTTRPDKGEWKADLLIRMPIDGLDSKVDKEAYNKKIKETAEMIVQIMKDKSIHKAGIYEIK